MVNLIRVGMAVGIAEVIPVQGAEPLIAAEVAHLCKALRPHHLLVLFSIQVGHRLALWLDDIRQQQRAARLQPCRHIREKLLLAVAIQVMHAERRDDTAERLWQRLTPIGGGYLEGANCRALAKGCERVPQLRAHRLRAIQREIAALWEGCQQRPRQRAVARRQFHYRERFVWLCRDQPPQCGDLLHARGHEKRAQVYEECRGIFFPVRRGIFWISSCDYCPVVSHWFTSLETSPPTPSPTRRGAARRRLLPIGDGFVIAM